MVKDLETLYQFVLKPLEGKLGGRVSKYLKTWQATCGGETFIALGMRSYWKDAMKSPERLRNLPRPKEYKFTSQQEAEFQKLLNDEIEQGIVIEVPWNYPAYLSPVFMVIKKGGEWRKVIDCRTINAEQVDIHFCMDSPETVQRLMIPGDWATSLDLKSAFNHLIVDEAMRPFLCFTREGRYYAYRAMPFGAKHSPRVFTEALAYPLKYIREHWDVRIVAYMNDILLQHQDKPKLELATWQIAAYLSSLG
jgi:hypothetical protein